jgi:hypothetical protein
MDGRQDQIVYGYTDNLPVGPALQRAGISDNIDLSSRRADNFVCRTSPRKASARRHPTGLEITPTHSAVVK